MIHYFTPIQKIFITLVALCLVSGLVGAQNNTNQHTTTEASVKAASMEMINIGKKYADQKEEHVSSSQPTVSKKEKSKEDDVVSFLNRTIEELEQRAEKQYQSNQYVFIKEEE